MHKNLPLFLQLQTQQKGRSKTLASRGAGLQPITRKAPWCPVRHVARAKLGAPVAVFVVFYEAIWPWRDKVSADRALGVEPANPKRVFCRVE